MTEWVTLSITMPALLAQATLEAAEACGQRSGPQSLRLEHFVILSERSFERLLEGLKDHSESWQKTPPGWALKVDCGGAAAMPGQGSQEPAPAAPPGT